MQNNPRFFAARVFAIDLCNIIQIPSIWVVDKFHTSSILSQVNNGLFAK